MKSFLDYLSENEELNESEYEVVFDAMFDTNAEQRAFNAKIERAGLIIVSSKRMSNGNNEYTIKGDKNKVVKFLNKHGMDANGYPL